MKSFDRANLYRPRVSRHGAGNSRLTYRLFRLFKPVVRISRFWFLIRQSQTVMLSHHLPSPFLLSLELALSPAISSLIAPFQYTRNSFGYNLRPDIYRHFQCFVAWIPLVNPYTNTISFRRAKTGNVILINLFYFYFAANKHLLKLTELDSSG